MKKSKLLLISSVIIISSMLFSGCGIFDNLIDETPTKSKMIGVWQLTAAYDTSGLLVTDKINFPVTAFQLSSNNDIKSTAGPMFMRTVYGSSNYTNIASKIDQVFNYTQLQLTDGEWFIADGIVSRFTIEMKLEGLPGQKSLAELLRLIGIQSTFINPTIYHKFLDIRVAFDAFSDSVMTWEFDNQSTAKYNFKNSQGEYVAWDGYSPLKFTKGKYVFKKRIKTIEDVIREVVVTTKSSN
jgi:hypothetical protein